MAPIPGHWFSEGVREWEVPAGGVVVRAHAHDRHPIFFGPAPGRGPQYRFDAPNEEFRVLYAAERQAGAFTEGILHRTDRLVSRGWLRKRRWSELTCARTLRLAKVFDDGLLFHGVDASISAGDYPLPQAFALALHTQFHEIDGIAYRARHDNGEICYAIFDRVGDVLSEGPPQDFFDDPAGLARLIARYGAILDLSPPIPPIV